MASPSILVINSGSSSLKFSVFEVTADIERVSAHGEVTGIVPDTAAAGQSQAAQFTVADATGKPLHAQAVSPPSCERAMGCLHEWFAAHTDGENGFAAVGHRVVHGGMQFIEPVVVDAATLASLELLVPLAPLHQPHQLAAIRALQLTAPGVPQVACFDTAFHAGQATVAREYALPQALTASGIKRYGFHGLSYEYIVSALPSLAPECVGRRLVVAHLGSGASMCAIHQGRSVATTMGFSALDGLPMGTRCGALDPGVLLYLLQHEQLGATAIEHLLYEQSGLLGVSGLSADVRTLLASAAPAARHAIELFVYQIGRELGSLTAALGGLDALIFTAGVGEHAPPIRAQVVADAQWLGMRLDAAANSRGERRISTSDSAVSAWVIPTDENLMVARHTRQLLPSRFG